MGSVGEVDQSISSMEIGKEGRIGMVENNLLIEVIPLAENATLDSGFNQLSHDKATDGIETTEVLAQEPKLHRYEYRDMYMDG
ncbi:hypothetical protein V6N12_007586 [Hibiscus sabdariffa]|uniref:Uncharacterized protein n=1 Tax=Hibiscus sabdariffa TaxID=183260 RepID=A0ABR2F276_9ROSI